MRSLILAAAFSLALAAPGLAATHTIVYGPGSCDGGCVNGGDEISQLFGSVPDVVVQNMRLADGYVPVGGLNYWPDSYSGSSAAYVEDSSHTTRGAVALFNNNLAGGYITLVSADFGGWPNAAVDIGWELYSTGGTLSTGSVTTNPTGLTTVHFNVTAARNQPIALIFGPDAYIGGVQNIVFRFDETLPTQGGIPEPSSWAMLIAGFGLAGASLRRRLAHSKMCGRPGAPRADAGFPL